MNEPEPPSGSRASAFRVSLELKLGIAQRENGDLDAALETLTKAFISAQRAGGSELVIAAGRELGITLLAASRLHQAEQLLKQMLGATAEHYGEDSPEWAAAAEELALAVRARGDAPAAERLQREALETARGALGELDPMTWVLGMNLASAIKAHRLFVPPSGSFILRLSRGERDRNPYHAAVNFFTHSGRPFEPGELTISRAGLEGLAEAEPTFFAAPVADWTSAVVDRSSSAGPDPWDLNAEIDLARRIWDEHREALGEHHPQTLNSMVLVSRAAAPRDVGYALELGREAAEASEAVLGRGHLDTLSAFETLAALYELRGERRVAVDLRQENVLLRAADEGIIGHLQPPIENLAGSLTEPVGLLAESFFQTRALAEPRAEDAGDEVAALAIDEAAAAAAAEAELDDGDQGGAEANDELVTRTAHLEIEPSRPIDPGERFEVGVYVDCRSPEEDGSGALELKPAPGVTELDLRVWLVVSRHFEIEGPAVQPLHLDLREEVSSRLVFAVQAVHVQEYGDEDPEVRVLFSYMDWPSGEVRRAVPLSQVAAEEGP